MSFIKKLKSRLKSGNALLSFGAEFFVFQLVSKNVKIKTHRSIIYVTDIQVCNFACYFILVWNLVSHIEGGM
jgi:hypothetical protein